MNTGQGDHERKADTDHGALSANNAADKGHPVNDVAEVYPSTTRRTAIVIGVALALFCVSQKLLIKKTAY